MQYFASDSQETWKYAAVSLTASQHTTNLNRSTWIYTDKISRKIQVCHCLQGFPPISAPKDIYHKQNPDGSEKRDCDQCVPPSSPKCLEAKKQFSEAFNPWQSQGICTITIRPYFWTFWKKLKLRKTQNSSQIRTKLGPNFQKTLNLPTPLEYSCRNGDQSQKKWFSKLLVQNVNNLQNNSFFQ